MQTLGRFAIIGGTVLVALANVILFRDVEGLEQSDKIQLYGKIYIYALVIPVVSILGVILASYLRNKKIQRKILLTIDDGFSSFYENAWPYLKEKKIPSFILDSEILLSKTLNLIGKSTEKDIWVRHFLDSSQVIDLISSDEDEDINSDIEINDMEKNSNNNNSGNKRRPTYNSFKKTHYTLSVK